MLFGTYPHKAHSASMQQLSLNFILPPEVLNHIFSFLSPYELTKVVSLVCYQFNIISCTNTLWKCLFLQFWNGSITPRTGEDMVSWKYYFAKRSALEHNWITGNCTILKYEGHTNWVCVMRVLCMKLMWVGELLPSHRYICSKW